MTLTESLFKNWWARELNVAEENTLNFSVSWLGKLIDVKLSRDNLHQMKPVDWESVGHRINRYDRLKLLHWYFALQDGKSFWARILRFITRHDFILSRTLQSSLKLITNREEYVNIKTTRITFTRFVCLHDKNLSFKAWYIYQLLCLKGDWFRETFESQTELQLTSLYVMFSGREFDILSVNWNKRVRTIRSRSKFTQWKYVSSSQ